MELALGFATVAVVANVIALVLQAKKAWDETSGDQALSTVGVEPAQRRAESVE